MGGPRRGIARRRLADLLEQRRAQPHDEIFGHDVGGFRRLADPLAEMIEVEFIGHDCLARAGRFQERLVRSPIAGTLP